MSQEITSIAQALEVVKARYENDEKIRKTLKDYKDPIELTFLATNTKALINVKGDQGIEVKQSGDDSAPVKIHFEAEQTMLDLLNKKLGAVAGYSSGKIKVASGVIKNLIKLRKLLF
jgi:putative sterol carrier protein